MQNRIVDQSAFILHRRDYQDSSLILEVFTEEYGRLSILAKGAKKRRDAAHFQLGNRLSIGWTGRSELKTLTLIDSKTFVLSTDIYMMVFYINELILYLLPKYDEYQALFQRYQYLILEFSQQDLTPRQMESLLRVFEIELLTDLGLMPDLGIEGISNQEVKQGLKYIINMQSGVRESNLEASSTYNGEDLLAIQNRQFSSERVLKSAKKLLRKIIDYNLQGRTLQSRQFYQQLKKNI